MSNELTPKGYLGSQVERRFAVGGRDNVTPPLPEKIGIEINNSCNHQCYFCPNPTMERQRSVMNDDMVRRVVHEAYDAGIHQISFYSGGEPFLNRKLADYVLHAKDLGFDYCYLSSNGGKAVTGRLRKVLEAGLDSLKFSINGGDRATYHAVHGRDEFEDVVRNVEFVANYREKYNPNLKLFISFVQTPLNRMSFEKLKTKMGSMVEEVIMYPFVVIGTPLKKQLDKEGKERPFIGYDSTNRDEDWNQKRLRLPCYQLWSYLNVTVEGYLSACCSDYNNDLVVGNLHNMSLADAWHSSEFQELRRRHIEREVWGTLCEGCIKQEERPYVPINMHLRTQDRKTIDSEAHDGMAELGAFAKP